jgi:hypothetical protein
VEKVAKDVFDSEELQKLRQIPDVKENFECGREDDPVMPNIWLPDGVLPGFKEACLDFYWVRLGRSVYIVAEQRLKAFV